MRRPLCSHSADVADKFLHLRVGTFIEVTRHGTTSSGRRRFPHLRVGTFIEASPQATTEEWKKEEFPCLRVGTFIEVDTSHTLRPSLCDFPAFGRGLSLRPTPFANRYRLSRLFPCLRAGIFIVVLNVHRGILRGLRSPCSGVHSGF